MPEFRIRPCELALPLAEGPEDLAGVADQLLDRSLLRVEHAQQLVRVLGERREVGDRGREVGAAPVAGDGELLHPGLERSPGVGIEGPEDLIQLN